MVWQGKKAHPSLSGGKGSIIDYRQFSSHFFSPLLLERTFYVMSVFIEVFVIYSQLNVATFGSACNFLAVRSTVLLELLYLST